MSPLPVRLLICNLAVAGLVVASSFVAAAQPAPCRIEVQADQPGAAIAKTMYGVFFEDINFGADGGLSAELVKNGSFEFFDPIYGWAKVEPTGGVGGFSIRTEEACFKNNPSYARMSVVTPGSGFGLRNEGYRGMGVKRGERYRFSAYVRLVKGDPLSVRLELISRAAPTAGGPPVLSVIGDAKVEITQNQWTKVEAVITAAATDAKAALQLLADQPGSFDLESVSLMPESTWKNRPNGLRADLVQMLADLKPGFVRFPGGCIVEGKTLPSRYQWKNTIGPVEERRLGINRWNTTFAQRGRGALDYFQSFRVGFFEYFLLCEDIGAEPLPIINCGMACQFDSGECVPLDDLAPYIQDALDLIEFANGPVTSGWGRRRAEMGHPEPFGLKTLGIGNEQWGPQYFERYNKFAAAIRARHPEVKLVLSAGPKPDDEKFAYAWAQVRSGAAQADLMDEHCYAEPDWFLNAFHRYDAYDRKGPKVFMGEYAAHIDAPADPARKNTWLSALAEAAFMAGMERNADVVTMSSYAPLFAHVDAWQWTPDLIWMDNLRVHPTPNYYVQQLFSLNRGDAVVPVKVGGVPTAANGQPRVYVTASTEKGSGDIIIKAVNATADDVAADVAILGAAVAPKPIRVISLGSSDLNVINTLDHPTTLAPAVSQVPAQGPSFTQTLPARSLVILRVPTRK